MLLKLYRLKEHLAYTNYREGMEYTYQKFSWTIKIHGIINDLHNWYSKIGFVGFFVLFCLFCFFLLVCLFGLFLRDTLFSHFCAFLQVSSNNSLNICQMLGTVKSAGERGMVLTVAPMPLELLNIEQTCTH